MCPAGTVECTSFDAPAPTVAPVAVCPPQSCATGTFGPCQQSNGVCWPFFPGTTICPTGTSACYARASPTPAPYVYVDAHGAQVSVSSYSHTYGVSLTSDECSGATITLQAEPCYSGQPGWNALCLPLVVTLTAATTTLRRQLGTWRAGVM